MFRKYCFVRQHDITDCGAACLATISKHYGYHTSIAKIREIAGTDKQGTNGTGILKAAKALGFHGKGVKGNKNLFFSKFPLPCIAHLVVDGHLMHYVVIHKITKQQIIIADPNKGIVKLKPCDFFGDHKNQSKPCHYQWSGILFFFVPNEHFKVNDEKKELLGRFINLLLPQRNLIFSTFLVSIVYTVLEILGAFYFKLLLDYIIPHGLFNTLHIASICILLLHLFRVLLNAFRSHLLLCLNQKLDLSILLGYYKHVLELPINFFETRQSGEIISRFQDASNIRDILSSAILTIMIDTIIAVAGGTILYLQNSYMFSITLIIVLSYCIIIICFNKTYKRHNELEMESNGDLTSYMVESLNGIQTIKAYSAENDIKKHTETKFFKLQKNSFKLCKISNLQNTLISFIESAGRIIILWLGASFVIKGLLTTGELIAFCTLSIYFINPIKNLINLQSQMQTAIAAADRLREILELELERTPSKKQKSSILSLYGTISIKNVTFGYGTRNPVISNLSMNIQPGEKIAFVGASGSGKSTLSKLLLRFYKPEKGDIFINHINLNDIPLDILREKIVYIPQETFLFSGTILENLTLGLTEYKMDEVICAAKKAQIHSFISQLPFKYETRIEENGANLSGGQKQRLSIARAILRKPEILILDEATSHLDSLTEQAIIHMIYKNSHMTIIIITHKLNTINQCDKIYGMNNGNIIQTNNYPYLINK